MSQRLRSLSPVAYRFLYGPGVRGAGDGRGRGAIPPASARQRPLYLPSPKSADLYRPAASFSSGVSLGAVHALHTVLSNSTDSPRHASSLASVTLLSVAVDANVLTPSLHVHGDQARFTLLPFHEHKVATHRVAQSLRRPPQPAPSFLLCQVIGATTDIGVGDAKRVLALGPDALSAYAKDLLSEELYTSATEFVASALGATSCSLPVAVKYSAGTSGGAAGVLSTHNEYLPQIEACTKCRETALLNGTPVSCTLAVCSTCHESKKLCPDCAAAGHSHFHPDFRACQQCIDGSCYPCSHCRAALSACWIDTCLGCLSPRLT